MDLERFVNHFGFKVVRVKNDRPYMHLDGYDSYKTSYYTRYDQSTIEMEIGRVELENMADYFVKTDKMLREDHEEHVIRRENPAVKEAYDKYKMLLELYR